MFVGYYNPLLLRGLGDIDNSLVLQENHSNRMTIWAGHIALPIDHRILEPALSGGQVQ